MRSNYAEALKRLLVHEGGNDDDPRDPGGRTSRGIIQSEWNRWRLTHAGLPADVWQAPQGSVEAIYREQYWDALDCDALPAGVDYAVFDYGVNSGIGRAARVRKSVAGRSPVATINAICDERLAFLQSLRTWGTFGNGWGTRVREVRAAALTMAHTAAPATEGSAPAPAARLDASKLVAAMRRNGFHLSQAGFDIVYVEGMNLDGTQNANAPDHYNDLRILLRDGKIVGAWKATTEPGAYYTHHRINSGGAARIAFGQYAAWRVGMHRGDHEALIQTGGEVTVCRDDNEDFKRDGDARDTGDFGINQHGPHGSSTSIGGNSAGCLVASSMADHEAFMALVKTDPRYVADHSFVFSTAILWAEDVLSAPVPSKPVVTPAPAKAIGIGATVVATVAGIAAFAGDHLMLVGFLGVALLCAIVGVTLYRNRNRP